MICGRNVKNKFENRFSRLRKKRIEKIMRKSEVRGYKQNTICIL